MNLEKLITAAMRSPLGTLILICIFLYLLTIILGLCGCTTPRCGDPHADGPDTTQKFDEHGHPNFGA